MMPLLALVDDLGVRRDRAPPCLKLGQARQRLCLLPYDTSSSTMNTATVAILPVVAVRADSIGDYSRLVQVRSQTDSLTYCHDW
jgi:hypothetical protein